MTKCLQVSLGCLLSGLGFINQGLEIEFFIDNLLVRIHFIIVMIRWTGLWVSGFEQKVSWDACIESLSGEAAGFGVQGSGSRVQGYGLRVEG